MKCSGNYMYIYIHVHVCTCIALFSALLLTFQFCRLPAFQRATLKRWELCYAFTSCVSIHVPNVPELLHGTITRESRVELTSPLHLQGEEYSLIQAATNPMINLITYKQTQTHTHIDLLQYNVRMSIRLMHTVTHVDFPAAAYGQSHKEHITRVLH